MTSNAASSFSLRVQWILCAAGIAVLAIYAAVGFYNRPYADDLCMAALADRLGIVGAVGHTYWTWSGNVTGLFYQTIGAAYQIYPVAPLFLLLVWTVAFTWLSYELLSILSCSRPWPVALIAGIALTLAVLSVSPNLFQALYWVNGTANYAFPTAVTVGLAAVLVRVARLGFTRVRLWTALLLTVIAAGGQATTAVFITGCLALVMLVVWWFSDLPYRRGLLQILIPAFVVAVLMALVVALTPGNDIRQAALSIYGIERQPLPLAVFIAFTAGLSMLVRTIGEYGVMIHILLFAAAVSLGLWLQPAESVQRLLHPAVRRFVIPFALLVGWGIFVLGVFPSAYTLGRVPAERTWIVPQMAWLFIFALAGYISGLNFRSISTQNASKIVGTVGSLVVSAIFGLHIFSAFTMAVQMQNFAEDHDGRVAHIQVALNQQETRVVMPPFDIEVMRLTLLDPLLDEICLGQYYRVETITAPTGS